MLSLEIFSVIPVEVRHVRDVSVEPPDWLFSRFGKERPAPLYSGKRDGFWRLGLGRRNGPDVL